MALPKSTVSKWCVSSITYDKKNYGNIGVFNALQVAWNVLTRCGRKVMRLIFYLPTLFFSNINVILFKTVLLGSYTPMETFPRLVVALEDFNRYGLQHVRYTLLDVCSSRTNCQQSFFIKTSLKGSEKGSFSWDQTLHRNGSSIMTMPHVTLPSLSQNVLPQRAFLWFPSSSTHLTSAPVIFSFS
jgi:hypothetical protein